MIRNGTVIATYMSPDDRPSFPFSPLLFDNVVIRLLGSDDFPAEAKAAAVRDLGAACAAGALRVSVARTLPLARIAEAHDLVASGRAGGRVVLAIR